MTDLTSKPLIVAKGILFGIVAALSSIMIVVELPTLRTAALIAVALWASCRFYYFAFYALERYVDPSLRYPGIVALLLQITRRRRRATAGAIREANRPPS